MYGPFSKQWSAIFRTILTLCSLHLTQHWRWRCHWGLASPPPVSILTGYLVGTSLWWGCGQPFSCEKLGFKVTLKNGPRTLGFSQQPLSLLTLALPCEKPERSLMGADPLTQYISFIFPLSYYSTCTLLKFPVSTVPCVSVFLLLFHILMTFFRV